MPDLSIVVPTYRERKNLKELAERIDNALQGIEYELVIVDDDSPDRTWELAQELSDTYPIKPIRRTEEKGLGTAVVKGFEESTGERIIVMDGDLQHPPEKLSEIYEKLKDNDLVIASRKKEGGGVEDWPLHRKLISRGAEFLSRVLLEESRTTSDPMSGFFGLRRTVIEDVKLRPEGYKILLEVLEKGNYETMDEVPYLFESREEGSSSLGMAEYIKYLRHLFKLSFQTGEIFRFLKFCVVGLTGVFVNMGILYLLTEFVGIYYLVSGLLAVESAIVSNFVLNELWTFRDRGGGTKLHRFGKFNLVAAGGLVINLAVLFIFTEFAGLYYLLSNLLGIFTAAIFNFSMNTLHTWREKRI